MKFTTVVIHFEVKARDGTTKTRQAIIERGNGVDAIFLTEDAARQFVKDKKIAAQLKRPFERHVRVIEANGQEVPRPSTQSTHTPVAGVLPLIPADGEGPGNWYLVEEGIECW